MKNRRIFLRLLAVIMVLSLAVVMAVVVSAEDDDVVVQIESDTTLESYVGKSDATYESDYVIRYEGESVFWYEGESFVLNGSMGEIQYETSVVLMWVCDCGKTNMGDSCAECGAKRPETFVGSSLISGVIMETEAPTVLGKAEDLLGCDSTVAVGSVVAVTILAGVCLVKRKKSDD